MNDRATFIVSNAAGPFTFILLDVMGRCAHTAILRENEFVFDGRNLPAGIYTYSIFSASGMTGTGKLVVSD